jgi:hypothetical protein
MITPTLPIAGAKQEGITTFNGDTLMSGEAPAPSKPQMMTVTDEANA